MVKALLFDFSRVLLFPKGADPVESLNGKYRELMKAGQFDFFEHFRLNDELLDIIYRLQDDFDLYLFTSETIQEAPELQESLEIFQKIFSAQQMNLDKKDPVSYQELAREMRVAPEEVLFIDDSLVNLASAAQTGMQVVHYKSNEQLTDSLRLLGLNP